MTIGGRDQCHLSEYSIEKIQRQNGDLMNLHIASNWVSKINS